MRRAAKVDGNHREIVNALRMAGCSVADLSGVGGGVPDLLVVTPVFPHESFLMECKNLKGRGNKLTLAQQTFRAAWKGRLVVVTSTDEALSAAGVMA